MEPDECLFLILQRHRVGLDQSVCVPGYITVGCTVAIGRIETDPRTGFLVPVSDHSTDVFITVEFLYHLSGGLGTTRAGWFPFSILVKTDIRYE